MSQINKKNIKNTYILQKKKYSENGGKGKHSSIHHSQYHSSNPSNTLNNSNNNQSLTSNTKNSQINGSSFSNSPTNVGNHQNQQNSSQTKQKEKNIFPPSTSYAAKSIKVQTNQLVNTKQTTSNEVGQSCHSPNNNSNLAFTFSSKFKDNTPPQHNISSGIFQNHNQSQTQPQVQENVVSEYDIKQMNENDKKLKESFQLYNNIVKKNEGTSLNTLFKIRTILINWLKDSDQDLEYSKFMTEKKIRYLLKNKEKMEGRIKVLEGELTTILDRKKELENILGDLYVNYEEDELKLDINRFENSYEVKSGKCTKTLEKLEEMKKMLPLVSEMGKIKESESQKSTEKKELERIIKSSNQTLMFLSNYYKNIKRKINEL